MNSHDAQLRVDDDSDANAHDARPGLSQDELAEIRDALRVLRGLRALVKAVDLVHIEPAKLPPSRAQRPTDEHYAQAVANVMRRMKGKG